MVSGATNQVSQTHIVKVGYRDDEQSYHHIKVKEEIKKDIYQRPKL
jgi:hypothetical protein